MARHSADTIIVCDSHTNNMSKTTLVEAQLIDIEPLTFALPKAKVNTRSVWPGRIKVIYSKYIAKKAAF